MTFMVCVKTFEWCVYIHTNLARPLQKTEKAVNLPSVHYSQAAQEVPWPHTPPGIKAFFINILNNKSRTTKLSKCILCVLLGPVLGTVQDLLYDPETDHDKAPSLIVEVNLTWQQPSLSH